MYHLKKKVKNKARVESSISEAYMMEEISNFCSNYFKPHVLKNSTRVRRNDDEGNVNERGMSYQYSSIQQGLLERVNVVTKRMMNMKL